MLDRDLAALYEIQTKVLKRAVKRNIGRFPGDFMFVMTREELAVWRRQFGASNGAAPADWVRITRASGNLPSGGAKAEDGLMILVVEYKNTRDWDLPDNIEKRQLGELWARRSAGKGLFIMPRGGDWSAIRGKLSV